MTREGTFYYVMEILDGLDLESLVRRFGPVPAERAAHLLVHACDSLDDAHFAGLVHRDIKPAYLAPEIVLGERAIDGRVDIYGLGCVAYWLVSGQRVFEGTTSMELVLHHVQTPPVPPSRRAGFAVPGEREDLILACLEKDPARRPTSARELARLLEATGLPRRWTPERAHEWWDAHVPPAQAAAR